MQHETEIVKLTPGTPEWLMYRNDHYNASEAGAVMCCNNWFPKNIYDLVVLRKGLKKVEYNAAMKHGNDNEEKARLRLNELLGVSGAPLVIRKGKYSASLDWCHSLAKGNGIGEIKCPFTKTSDYWMAAVSGEVKAYSPSVYWQMQHQMMVACAEECQFFVWSEDQEAHCVVKADEKDQELLLGGWQEFESLMEKAGSSELETAAAIYREKAFNAEVAEVEAKAAKEKLLALAGDNFDGYGIKIRTTARIGAVDYAKVPELKGVDLEQYRKKSSSVVSVKIEKE